MGLGYMSESATTAYVVWGPLGIWKEFLSMNQVLASCGMVLYVLYFGKVGGIMVDGLKAAVTDILG